MNKLIYILFLLSIGYSAYAQESMQDRKLEPTITSINVYPNPFNSKTNISFYSSADTSITFVVQDLLGNIVKSENILLAKGRNSIPFYRNKLVAGIYLYTLKTKTKVISKRFVIK